MIVDPVNPQNNTARNSHRTPDILKKFREAFTHLKSLIQGEYTRLQKLKQEQQQAAILASKSETVGEKVASPSVKEAPKEAEEGKKEVEQQE